MNSIRKAQTTAGAATMMKGHRQPMDGPAHSLVVVEAVEPMLQQLQHPCACRLAVACRGQEPDRQLHFRMQLQLRGEQDHQTGADHRWVQPWALLGPGRPFRLLGAVGS